MIAAYLGMNALLYLLFAAWCSLDPAGTAHALGFESLSRGGRSEFLVTYGGLHLGLAAAFAGLAARRDLRQAGLAFSLFLYGGIVLYRAVTLWMHGPVPALTWAIAVGELLLLVIAAILWLTK